MTIELATLVAIIAVAVAVIVAAVPAAITFGRLSQRVTTVEDNINLVRLEITGLRTEMLQLRTDVHTDMHQLRTEMAGLRAEVRADIGSLRTEMGETRAELERTNRLLIGMANHRHASDGNILFTAPQVDPA